MRSLLGTLLLCALAFAGCGPRPVAAYGDQEIIRLEAGQPSPWTGWLLSDTELEHLLKTAQHTASGK